MEKVAKALDERGDMINRQWNILNILEVEPSYKSKKEIIAKLLEKGYTASEKTIRRDLEVLGLYFDIFNKNNKIAYTKTGTKPFITTDFAFLLDLVKKVLENTIPENAISVITPYFKATKDSGKDSANLKKLSDKIEVIYSSPLIPPKISEKILSSIYEAVLGEKRVEIKYFKYHWEEEKNYILNSLGIVIKDQVIYFICKEDTKDFVMYLPAHRIKAIKVLNEKSFIPENFNLKEYADKNIQKWINDENSELLDFKAEFNKDIAFMVIETPISKNQIITEKENGDIIVEASIPDSIHFRHWLLSLGPQIKVVKPKVLREYFKDIAFNLANLYNV